MAVRFNGAGEYLLYDAGAPSGALTMMAWFYATNVNTDNQCLFWAGSDSASNAAAITFYLGITNGQVDLYSLASGARGTADTVWSANTWYHFCFAGSTTANAAATVYLNGVDDNGPWTNGAGTYSAGRVQIGNDPFTSDQFDGRVAAFKVWNATLTTAEIQNEMRFYTPQRLANLYQWAPLVNHSNLVDYAGNARSFSAGGTLSTEDGPPIAWRPRRPRFWVPAAAAAATGGARRLLLGVG